MKILIYQKEVKERFGFSKATIAKFRDAFDLEVGRAPARGRARVYDRARVEKLIDLRDQLETCNAVSKRTRIPIPALRILVANGYISTAGDVACVLLNTKQPVFTSDSVEKQILRPIERLGDRILAGERLGTFLHFAAFHGRGWSDAIESVMDGRVKCIVDKRSLKRFAYRLIIDDGDMDLCLKKIAEQEARKVPLGLAACVLRIEARTLAVLAKEHTAANFSDGYLTLEQMDAIKIKFATVSQLSSELELSKRTVYEILKGSDILPVLPIESNFQPLYIRDHAIKLVEIERSIIRRLPLD